MLLEKILEFILNEQDKQWNYQDSVMDHNVRNVQGLTRSTAAMSVVYKLLLGKYD